MARLPSPSRPAAADASFTVLAKATGTGADQVMTYEMEIHGLLAKDPVPPGRYTVQPTMKGVMLVAVKKPTNLLRPTGETCDAILEDFKTFFSPETKKIYEEFGLNYRRGILVHGEPGTGKTCLFNFLADEIVKKGGYVLSGQFHLIAHALKSGYLKGPRVIIFDEFEEMEPDHNPGLLEFLDGVGSPGDTYIMAATNYLHKLPKRITERPSRFAKVLKLGCPDAAVRRAFLLLKLPARYLTPGNPILEQLITASEGLTLDQTQDLMLGHLVFGKPLEAPAIAVEAADAPPDFSQYDDNDTDEQGLTARDRAENAYDDAKQANLVAAAVVEKMQAAAAAVTPPMPAPVPLPSSNGVYPPDQTV